MKPLNYIKNLYPLLQTNSFPFLEKTFDDIDEYAILARIQRSINEVITNNNILNDNFTELNNYVNDYFKNLDVQDEVDKKLQEMAEDGTLSHIINEELFTKINNNLLNYVNVKNFGAIGDGNADDTQAIQNAINTLQENDILYFPKGTYKITPQNQYNIKGFGSYVARYGLYFNNKNNFKVLCEGTIIPDISTYVMNIFAFQNCNNVIIDGINASYEGDIPLETNILQCRSLCNINKCNNVIVKNTYSKNVGGNVIFTASNNCKAINCFAERTDINYKSSALFGMYATNNSIFENCTGYGSSNDGDISIYGNCNYCNVINCKIFNKFQNNDEIAYNIAQGICVDSGATYITITNCYTYGYYYGIDVKTACDSVIVSNNQCIKNKIGIAVRLGEGNQETLNTIINGNSIYPDGGNGTAGELIKGFSVAGILLENTFGVQVLNNLFANHYSPSGNNPFIGIYFYQNKSYKQIFKCNSLIKGNTFNFYNTIGSNVNLSNSYAIYIAGTEATILENIEITENTFKMPLINGTQYHALHLEYVTNAIISNNLFSKRNASTSNIFVKNVKNSIISNNIIEQSRNNLAIYNCDNIQINDNMIQSPGENYYTIIVDTSTHIIFNNNTYKQIGTTNEAVICICNSSNYISAIGNVCTTKQSEFLTSNPSSPSQNLNNSDTNLFWSST